MTERVFSVMITEKGRQRMKEVIKYFENDKLTVIRRYTTSSGLINPPTPESIVTVLDIVSGNDNDTYKLVASALIELNKIIPGGANLYEEFTGN